METRNQQQVLGGEQRTDDPATITRSFITAIEKLRRSRREHYAHTPHPEQKRFTQEELRSAIPIFKNLHIGRTQRLPNRAVVIQIADYLECSITERNDLLLAAQYVPEFALLPDDQYQATLSYARSMLHAIPLPAALVSPGWYEEDINTAFLALYGDGPSVPFNGRDGAALPWLLDPHLAEQGLHAPNSITWHTNAQNALHFFHHIHRPFQHQTWLQNIVQQLHIFPHFTELWSNLQNVDERSSMNSGVLTLQTSDTGIQFQEKIVAMSISTTVFPLIVCSVPLDNAARYIYRSRGIPVNESHWDNVVNNQIYDNGQKASISISLPNKSQ